MSVCVCCGCVGIQLPLAPRCKVNDAAACCTWLSFTQTHTLSLIYNLSISIHTLKAELLVDRQLVVNKYAVCCQYVVINAFHVVLFVESLDRFQSNRLPALQHYGS